MRVLSLDPSSTCTGWAVLEGLAREQLVTGGLIKPGHRNAIDPAAPESKVPDLFAWYGEPQLASIRRVVETLGDVGNLIADYEPDRIVVEVPSGKAGTGSKKGAKSSLTTYGMAAGAVWAYCLASAPGRAVAINERMWTARSAGTSGASGASGGKQGRAYYHETVYPGIYRSELDPGLDLSDAIGLGRWYLMQCKALGRMPAQEDLAA